MSVVINTNYAATVAANNLAYSNSMLQQSLNQLSSGSKLVNPATDAGGVAVAMTLTAAANRSGAALGNLTNSVSLLQTQDGVLQVAGSILDRMSQLSTLAADPTKSSTDVTNYNTEFGQLQTELTNLSGSGETFNGISLFGSTGFSVATTESGGGSLTIGVADLASTGSGVGSIIAAGNTGLSGTSSISLATINTAIQQVASLRATNGAAQSVLGFASTVLTNNQTNLQSAVSQISDVDVAQASTQLARWNVLVQAGTSMLAQANQSSQIALKLLG